MLPAIPAMFGVKLFGMGGAAVAAGVLILGLGAGLLYLKSEYDDGVRAETVLEFREGLEAKNIEVQDEAARHSEFLVMLYAAFSAKGGEVQIPEVTEGLPMCPVDCLL